MILRAALGSAISISALVSLCTPTPSRAQLVPAEAPDSVPATILEDARFVEESSGDLVSTTILSVSFDVTASHPEKEAAIRSVSGAVIGGAAGDVEGIYLVRVQGDGTIATIDSIAAELRSRPGVIAAFKFSWWRPATLVPRANRSSIALYLVLDPLQDANTATFRWVDGRARLVLHPSVGAFGLRSALRHLGRYARNDNPDWRPADDPVVLPVARPPHGYEREPAEYWDRLITATPVELKGHRVPVRVDSTRFGISKGRYQVPPVPPDTVPASFDEDAVSILPIGL